MSEKRGGKAVDVLLLVLTLLPITLCILFQILFKPVSEGISVSGAVIYFTIPMPIQDLPITESQINSFAVLLTVMFLTLFLTRRLRVRDISIRQHVAEWIVEKTEGLVKENMDPYFRNFGPLIGTILGISAFSSLLSLCGLFAPTSDLNIVAGWAIFVFVLITYYKFKCGPLYYLKGLTEPVAVLTPINLIGEFATPISMAFRHYGNVLSGSVIAVLVATGLQGLSSLVFGWIPILGEIPLLRIGIPAILSIYFDLFSGCLQAFIFAMLTMMYVSGGFPADDYYARRAKIEAKKQSRR